MLGLVNSKQELADLANREGGLFNLIFNVGYSPVRLPDDSPQDVISAWIRLSGQSRHDVELINEWLGLDDE